MNSINIDDVKAIIQQQKPQFGDSLEADIYIAKGALYKIYKAGSRKFTADYRRNKERKVKLLEALFSKSASVIVPHTIIFGKDDMICGVVMAYCANTMKLSERSLNASKAETISLMCKASQILRVVHISGCIVGDATAENYIVDDTGHCMEIDVDSFGIGSLKCDCTNKPTNAFLVENGLAEYTQLRKCQGITQKYDILTQYLSLDSLLKAKGQSVPIVMKSMIQEVKEKKSITLLPYLDALF